MLDAAQPEGAVAVTEEQTAGRGRMGRRWEAPAGSSLLVSTLLRPPPERRAAELTLVAGVAVAVVVERATGLAAQIKWPNDVMLDRRKVAGVLAELKDGAVVLGIGINVNQRPDELPAETKVAAGSLCSVTGREYERGDSSPTCCSSSSTATTRGARTGSTRSTRTSARATSSAAAASRVDGVAGTAQMITRDGRLAVDDGAQARSWSRAARSRSSAESSAGVFTFASSRGSASSTRGLTPRSEQSPDASRRSSSGRSAFE